MAEVVGGLTGTLQGSVQGLVDYGQSFLDKIVPPETREKIMAWISKFAAEKPQLAAFLASHIALSGPAIGLFLVMTLSLAIFAILVAIIIGVLGTVLFIVAMAGFGLIFLLPTLFVTTGIATFIWLWGLGCYYLLKYFNQKDIPGIHVPMKEGLEDEADTYGFKGQMQGYGSDPLAIGAGKDEQQGQEQRKEAEKSAMEKFSEKPGEAAEGAQKMSEKPMEAGAGVKDKGGKGVGNATDAVNGVAGATPAGGATKGITGATKGITG